MNHLLFKEGGGVSIENLVLHKMKELLLVPPQRNVIKWLDGMVKAVIVWYNILLSINQWHLLHIIKKTFYSKCRAYKWCTYELLYHHQVIEMKLS